MHAPAPGEWKLKYLLLVEVEVHIISGITYYDTS